MAPLLPRGEGEERAANINPSVGDMDVCNDQVGVVQSAQGSGGITNLGGFQEKGRCNTKECGLLGIVGMG